MISSDKFIHFQTQSTERQIVFMVYNDIKNVIRQFLFDGKYVSAEELTAGNINLTYKLLYRRDDGTDKQYVLQRINTFAFKKPEELMANIELVVSHIEKAMKAEGLDTERRILKFIPTKDGGCLYRDEKDNYWRADVFINDATAYNSIEDPKHFYEVGRGFGEFQRYLSDFPAEELAETIPDFHNTTKRFYAFVAAVAEDRAGRVAGLEKEIDFIFERRKMMNKIIALTENGTLPLRVTHNDTKLNNVLIDNNTGKAVCVIDLDTVMPGSILYDYGDAIRYGACTAAEDEPDTSKIGVDMELFRLFTDGFVSEIKDTVTKEELHYLPLGVLVMTCELAMRFLTDYINGDVYFKVQYPEHNIVRTRAQMKLLEEIEAHFEQMQAYVDELIK